MHIPTYLRISVWLAWHVQFPVSIETYISLALQLQRQTKSYFFILAEYGYIFMVEQSNHIKCTLTTGAQFNSFPYKHGVHLTLTNDNWLTCTLLPQY